MNFLFTAPDIWTTACWEDEQRQFPFTQHITLSIGVTYFPEHGSTYQELFQKVDTSMYNSKKGMHSYRIYADEE